MDSTQHAPSSRAPRGLLGRLLDLFSSITLGIWLLSLLFVYSTVGSAGIVYPTSLALFDRSSWTHAQLRQWRPFEMTEFEWFNWWPFVLLIGLVCLNLVVATLRRIPFRRLNLGVWMIHTGIITLSVGSVWYFSTKIEGDSPVVRRLVAVQLPSGESDSMPAVPGASMDLGGWRFDVSEVNLAWTLASGPDKGVQTLSVTVRVQGPSRPTFMRQLLDGYPQYTEDIIRSSDPNQPMARAIKETGKALVDSSLRMTLELAPQTHVYLANWIEKSWALYLRRRGDRDWVQRPIHDLPLYNDYIGSRDEIWLLPGTDLPLDPLDLVVPPSEPGDPLPDTDLRISAYLRYAMLDRRHVPGGPILDPTASVHLTAPGQPHLDQDLVAFDPERRQDSSGVLQLVWVDSETARQALSDRRDPHLKIRVVGMDVTVDLPLSVDQALNPSALFTPIEGTPYGYRVDFWRDDWEIEPGRIVSMAQVSVQLPERTYKRWVFGRPQAEQVDREAGLSPANENGDDHDHTQSGHGEGAHGGGQVPLDTGIDMTYRPGQRPAPITLVAGPGDEQLGLVLSTRSRKTGVEDVTVGEVVDLGDGVALTVTKYAARGSWQTRPAVVPLAQRERDVRERNAMIKVSAASGGAASTWVPFHQYPVRTAGENLRRYRYRPAAMQLDDGTVIELILSRQRLPLPAAVVLEDFELITHVGGYTGSNLSVLNWRSQVRFAEGSGWSDLLPVSVNAPAEYAGYWYFQAQWDPPSGPRGPGDPGSQGQNFTVLGVGNRNGVGVQLVGCCIAVLGMLYAFYVKPTLIRRMKARAAAAVERQAQPAEPRPTALAGEHQ